jgi:hypothetical protein
MKLIKKRTSRKGLVWTTDFLIGLMLFIIMVFIAVKIVQDMFPSQSHITVYRDAIYLSDNLLSEGYPWNWTDSDVILPGIAENNRINITKLSNFTKIDYYHAKTLLHVMSDFIFFIRNDTSVINTSQCTYGYNITVDENCTPILTGISYDNLARIDRLIIYNSHVLTMTVYAWD